MSTVLRVLVVGAGPAGLAVAGSLRARGVPFELLEKSRLLAASWHSHYDSLRLHSDKRHSELPGLPYPADYPRYVTKGQFLDYLQDYADRFHIRPRWEEEAVSARWDGGFWELRTTSNTYRLRNLVVATGHTARPNVPAIPGLEDSPITVVHSSGYRNAVPYRGKRVLVMGFGNSAGEIARDLYEGGANPTLAVRGPVNVVPREFFGVPLLSVAVPFSFAPAAVVDAVSAPLIFAARGTLKGTGLEKPPYGPFTQAQKYGRVPLIDTGIIPLMRQKLVPKMAGVARRRAPRGFRRRLERALRCYGPGHRLQTDGAKNVPTRARHLRRNGHAQGFRGDAGFGGTLLLRLPRCPDGDAA
jgi:indole-3-pyruvate monooxygenase